MTVAVNTNPRVEYTSNASQTTFTYNFLLLAQADLVVTVDGSVLTAGSGFTTTGVGTAQGGTFVLTSALTAGQLVVAYRDTAIQRLTDYQANGPLTAASLNTEFDNQTVIEQDTSALSNIGYLRLSRDNTGANINPLAESVSERGGRYLGFDTLGNPVVLDTVGLNKGDFAANTFYNQNDIVRNVVTLNVYQAKTAFTSGLTFTLSNWTLLFDATVRRITETTVTKNTSFTVNLDDGTVFILTAAGTVTMPTIVVGRSFTIIINTGTNVTWAGSPQWTQGNEPQKSAGRDIYTFICDGNNWYGGQVGTNFST